MRAPLAGPAGASSKSESSVLPDHTLRPLLPLSLSDASAALQATAWSHTAPGAGSCSVCVSTQDASEVCGHAPRAVIAAAKAL